MKSRYDKMKDSEVLDVDGVCFPDPLLNYEQGKLLKIPTLYTIKETDLSKFWVTMWEEYGKNYDDDEWLNINGVPYIMALKPGDQIYKVTPEDLEGFLSRAEILQ